MSDTAPVPAIPRRKSTLAMLSLILACCSLFTPLFVGSIASIVLGHMAMRELRRDPELGGKAMAIWGLVIGYVSIPVAFVIAYLVLRVMGH